MVFALVLIHTISTALTFHLSGFPEAVGLNVLHSFVVVVVAVIAAVDCRVCQILKGLLVFWSHTSAPPPPENRISMK